MKKCLLTSAGFENLAVKEAFLDLVGKEPSQIKALWVPTAAVDEEAHGFFAVAFVLVALVYEEAVHPYSSGGEVFGEEAVHGKAYEESVVVDGYGAPAGTGIGFL